MAPQVPTLHRYTAIFAAVAIVILTGCAGSNPDPAPDVAVQSPLDALCKDMVDPDRVADYVQTDLGIVIDDFTRVLEVCEDNPEMIVIDAVMVVIDEEANPDPILVAEFSDLDDYSYRAELYSASVTTESDKANARPGQVIVQMYFTPEATVFNTTDGYNAPTNGVVSPYWMIDSPVCKYALYDEARFCHFPGLHTAMYDLVDAIPDGGSSARPTADAVGLMRGLDVDIADVDAVVAALEQPAGYFIYATNSRGSGQASCLVGDFRDYVVARSGVLSGDLAC